MWGKMALGMGAVGAGSFLGAVYSGQTDGDITTGATVGGLTGAATVGAIANTGNVARYGVGKAVDFGKWATHPATQESMKHMAHSVGNKALVVGKKAGVIGAGGVAVGAATALKAGAKYGNIATSMFSLNQNFGAPGNNKGLLSLTHGGRAMLFGGAALSVGSSAFNTFNTARQGQSDGQVLTATPDFARSSMMRNAGATGDLAFSAYSQRHG